jgi:transposase, IS605 orfB family
MILVEKHIIKSKHKNYDELDNLCWLSKNLYNSTLYNVRQYYFENKKLLKYQVVNKMYVDTNNPDYRALPAKVSKHTQMLVEHNFKSFFELLKLKAKGKYNKPVKIPKYLNKKTGRQAVHYEKGAISFKEQGYIRLSKTNIKIKTKLTKNKVQFVRLVPKNNYIVIEIGYNIQEKEVQLNNNVLAIDIGVNNIASCVTTDGDKFLINGKPLKYINHNYNKRIADIQSKLKLTHDKNKSRYTSNITNKRNNRINDYLHKITTYIVNQAVSKNIATIVVGYNKEWKQDTNMSKSNNQNFVNIPFYTFISMLEYKSKLKGIAFKIITEEYTSKCSFIDEEEIERHTEYVGKRINRELFRTKKGIVINADVNGAYNILKKYMIKNETWNEKISQTLVKVCSIPSVRKINLALA